MKTGNATRLQFLVLFQVLCFAFLAIGAKAADAIDIIVQGKVVDENGAPMSGVNILEKGSVNGIVSDANGEYQLTVKDEKAVLVFSFIGYISQEIIAGGGGGGKNRSSSFAR